MIHSSSGILYGFDKKKLSVSIAWGSLFHEHISISPNDAAYVLAYSAFLLFWQLVDLQYVL